MTLRFLTCAAFGFFCGQTMWELLTGDRWLAIAYAMIAVIFGATIYLTREPA